MGYLWEREENEKNYLNEEGQRELAAAKPIERIRIYSLNEFWSEETNQKVRKMDQGEQDDSVPHFRLMIRIRSFTRSWHSGRRDIPGEEEKLFRIWEERLYIIRIKLFVWPMFD